MKYLISFILLLFLILTIQIFPQEKSSVCFTFDDGNPKDILDYNYLKWNQMILDTLKANNLQAVLYVCGKRLDNLKGKKAGIKPAILSLIIPILT